MVNARNSPETHMRALERTVPEPSRCLFIAKESIKKQDNIVSLYSPYSASLQKEVGGILQLAKQHTVIIHVAGS